MTMPKLKIISTSKIVNGKLPRDFEVEGTKTESRKYKDSIEARVRALLVCKKGINSYIEQYNTHIAKIKEMEEVGEAKADITGRLKELKLAIPKINYRKNPIETKEIN